MGVLVSRRLQSRSQSIGASSQPGDRVRYTLVCVSSYFATEDALIKWVCLTHVGCRRGRKVLVRHRKPAIVCVTPWFASGVILRPKTHQAMGVLHSSELQTWSHIIVLALQ